LKMIYLTNHIAPKTCTAARLALAQSCQSQSWGLLYLGCFEGYYPIRDYSND